MPGFPSRQSILILCLTSWAVLTAASCSAFQPPVSPNEFDNAPPPAPIEVPPGLRLRGFTKTIHTHAQPGGWLVLRANVANASSEALEGTLITTVEGVLDMQSTRTMNLPGKSEEFVDLYVSIPRELADKPYAEVTMGLYRWEGNREVLMDNEGQPMQHSLRLPIVNETGVTFTVIEPEPDYLPYWYWPPSEELMSYELAVSSRVASGNSRSTVSLRPQTVPPSLNDWEDVGVVIVSDPKAFDDAVAVEAMKRFVNNGGRLWIMLDQVDERRVRPLLASGQFCEVIDTVELNSFEVTLAERGQLLATDDMKVFIDKPARMKRVYQSGGTVSHSANGWPAAIWMKVGYGEILLTTLQSHAWLEVGSESDEPELMTDFKTSLWAKPLATQVHDVIREKPISSSVEYPLEFIGNSVLPRSLVASVLATFVGLLVLGGVLLARRGDLRRIGLFAPALAILVGCGLFLASGWIRREKVDTAAALQLIHFSADGQAASIREQAAMYLNSERDMQLASDLDGHAIAGQAMQSGIKRFSTGDYEHWELGNATWPPGTWRYDALNAIETEGMIATAELDAAGLRIKLPDAIELTDPLVGFVPGAIMLGEVRGSTVVADGSLLAGGDRWIAGTLITDEQRRRLDVYKEFFKPDDRVPLLPRVVYGWTDRWQSSAWSDPNLASPGAAMVALPIRLLQPPIGAELLVPPGLVQFQRDTRTLSRTSVYSDVTGRWQPNVSLGISADLRLLLPNEILPFKAKAIDLSLDIKAPHRSVRIVSTGGEQEVEIVSLDGPSIPWSGVITDPTILADALDGKLDIRLEISERTDIELGAASTTVVTWQIDSFRAGLRGSRIAE